MQHYTIRVDKAGRVLLPVSVRRELGIGDGSEVVLSVYEGEATLRTRHSAVAAAQAYFTKLAPKSEVWSDELIADRRKEAKKERGR